MDRISAHISYAEATKNAWAIRKNISNDPNQDQLENMRAIAKSIFEPLRTGLHDRRIRIDSFFRSPAVNEHVGGVTDSQHLCNDMEAAMDLDNDGMADGPTNREIFEWLRTFGVFDQLIWEFGDDNSPGWVHVSFQRLSRNRHQILKSIKRDGETHYIPYVS